MTDILVSDPSTSIVAPPSHQAPLLTSQAAVVVAQNKNDTTASQANSKSESTSSPTSPSTTTTTTTKQKTIMPGSSKERDEGARNVYEYYGQLQNKWFNNQNVYEMRTVKKPKNRRQYPEKKHVKRDYY
eukprot:m.142992 g.142992  ORF g.142992 m.142992 type:complete len:129 (-) comp16006_c5_seq14:348-734(-)